METSDDSSRIFRLWAPAVQRVDVHFVDPEERLVPMDRLSNGYFICDVKAAPGSRYFFRLNGLVDRPDPASRFQPEGVHGPSEVLSAPAFQVDEWNAPDLSEYILYEIHIGTFTPGGTFDAAIAELDRLQRLGVNAIELMPVVAFPGYRNWGYDGVYPYAIHHAYGGAAGFQRFVDACHARDMAVVLDVVYNHLGPEGNYLREFAPYFTREYNTPWGEAINFDGPDSDEVRRYFIENALYWIDDCRVDALRLDAVHTIFDRSARPFLAELVSSIQERAKQLGRRAYVIAESDLNDARLVMPPEQGGYNLDAQWADDLHHSIHALLTGERSGYYADYGELRHFAKSLERGWFYSGEYSQLRRRRFGNSPSQLPAYRLIVCSQNHDQVGNRMDGERLLHVVGLEKAKLAAAAVLLSPYLPLLFMGEEYGENAPFQYFVSHTDSALAELVRTGRRAEFTHIGEAPDPQDEGTFLRSKLNTARSRQGTQGQLFEYYRALIELRKTHPSLVASRDGLRVETLDDRRLVLMHRGSREHELLVLFHFGDRAATHRLDGRDWHCVLDSAETRWGGAGNVIRIPDIHLAPHSCVVLGRA